MKLVVLLPLLAACDPTSTHYRRNVRAPHMGVPLQSGQPLEGAVEVSAGLASVGDVIRPELGDTTQAVEVPAVEMRDELRLRLGTRGHLAFLYEQGFAATREQLDDTLISPGAGDVHGYGLAVAYSFATDVPGLAIGWRSELIGWSLPYVEQLVTSNGDAVYTSRGRQNPLSLGLGLTPSLRRGPLTYFGGFYLRNHPTATRDSTEVDPSAHDTVENGPFNLMMHAGLEVAITPWLGALAVVQLDILAEPVRYGPGLGVALTGRLPAR